MFPDFLSFLDCYFDWKFSPKEMIKKKKWWEMTEKK